MRFSDLTGNKEAIATLRSMVDSDRIPHALLLSGPSGIGKMMLAKAFVSYVNCENRVDGDSCGRCPACRRIDSGNDPDIHYVFPIVRNAKTKKDSCESYLEEWQRMMREYPYMDPAKWLTLMAAGNSQPIIYTDEADAISLQAAMSAYSDRYKIFLIWLPEKLHISAANKLLKVLEEPFEDTLFICVSNAPHEILPTIASRLRRVEVVPPSPQEIEQKLLRCGISPSKATEIASISGGSLLRAFKILESDGETEEFHEIFKDLMRTAYSCNVRRMRSLADNLAAMGREKDIRLLEYCSRMSRENFIANLCSPPLNAMTKDEKAFAMNFAPFIHASNIERILAEIDRASTDISRNANAKLVWFDFQIMLMRLLKIKRKAS